MIELLRNTPAVLAQVNHPTPGGYAIHDVANNFGSDALITTNFLLISVGALLLLISGISISRWWKHRNDMSHPLVIFTRVAGSVGLGYRDQWLLLWIAHRSSLSTPLTLMLSPGTYHSYVQTYLNRKSKWRREKLEKRTQAIGHTLYGDLPQA